MKDVEASVEWLEIFYQGIKDYRSKRIHATVKKHLKQLDDSGYANVQAVKIFREMYNESTR